MPETISYQRFRGRVEYLEQHIQVVDLAIASLFRATWPRRHDDVAILEALGFGSEEKHNRVNHKVDHAPRLFNYSKSRNFEHAIVSLYRYFSEYLRGVLVEMFRHDPLLVVGKAPSSATIQFAEVVKMGSYETLSTHMIGTVFRRLEEERSTIRLLDKILDHTGVAIPQPIKENGLMYLEMRHLFVHQDGKVDPPYAAKYGGALGLVVGDKLPTNFKATRAAIEAVTVLLSQIDIQLIANGLAAPRQ